ncbi:LysR family transcriptional regulator [Gluconacetobacter azotocaptans]|uniref:LysR family transcriptional regulator n=1 Tax=Gluconacetobacter azotocaptans TaxID=142834 RepID=A0A7W4JUF9_9PROT|nr:hydrogen peroxide-inducible genes activator [Gluconacetobacter azotocaptans]MBB2191117.1 LysR family transcriptional regulator [Gluconacetobacter azotocaptans]MBM9402272.1 LysR family transcriptional regulator [Gluconacetobacter azotocaptans]GBQ33148.1 oxidative stress regulatory protein OxyR [Gluconacetobacter azotocaptans DSM 13594]
MSYLPLAGLSLRDIEYAVAVADLQHFGRAADRCGVSQAGLSEQVRKLEDLLGVALFERTRRQVSVTPEGERLLAQGRDILAAARTMLEMARQHTGPLSGILRLGIIATLGPYYMPALLQQIRDAYPDLKLRLEESRTAAMLRMLRANELDVAIVALPLDEAGLATEAVFREPFMAVFPSGHAHGCRPAITQPDLAGPDLLLLEEGHCLRDQALSLCSSAAGAAHDGRLATSLEMLWHMIGAGEGYSLIPLLALQNRADVNGLIEIVPVQDDQAARTIGLVWRASDPRADAYRAFAGLLRTFTPQGCQPVPAA